MAAQKKIIFYDLVAEHGGPYFSPNTLKTRFSLLHKGVDFDEREVTFMELREMGPKMGLERAISAPAAPSSPSSTCIDTLTARVSAQFLASSSLTGPSSMTHGTSPSVSAVPGRFEANLLRLICVVSADGSRRNTPTSPPSSCPTRPRPSSLTRPS